MMQAFRVLIVDDQRDVRRVLRDGIHTLDSSIDVIDVPSGEEAILVISRQPIDLIIVDIRLPGISGLELMERAQIRNPNMKFVLITGMDNQKIRDEVASSGADAYFFKPINISQFLDYVEDCFSANAPAPKQTEKIALEEQTVETEVSTRSLSDHLSGLQQELDALCVLLIDENNQIVAQVGDLPEVNDGEESFLASLMATLSSTSKVSYNLGLDQPQDLHYFVGQGTGYILAHVGLSLGLLVVCEVSGWDDEQIWTSMRSIPGKVQDLASELTNIGVYSEREIEALAPDVVEPEDDSSAEATLTEFDEIFRQAKKKVKQADVDAFWDSVSAEEPDTLTGTDAISYEQARQLGLAPEEE